MIEWLAIQVWILFLVRYTAGDENKCVEEGEHKATQIWLVNWINSNWFDSFNASPGLGWWSCNKESTWDEQIHQKPSKLS